MFSELVVDLLTNRMPRVSHILLSVAHPAVCWAHAGLHGGQAALAPWGASITVFLLRVTACEDPTAWLARTICSELASFLSSLRAERKCPVKGPLQAREKADQISQCVLPGCLAFLTSQRLMGSRLVECGIIHSACQ